MSTRVLVISPVYNEAAHITVVVDAMARQTHRPVEWVVVDDGSTDETVALLEALSSSVPFMRLLSAPPAEHWGARDRLAAAGDARTFNFGLARAATPNWDFIAKIDGDIELPPQYFEWLLERFATDPDLGMASGDLIELTSPRVWRRVAIPPHNVPGALKLYSRDCFLRIGGISEALGWDSSDEIYARLHGYSTHSYRALVARHHRPTGSANGRLRGMARHGACAWIVHYPLYFVLARSLKLAGERPIMLSGAAFLYGYLAAAVRSLPRIADMAFRAHVHAELRHRVAGWILRRTPRGGH